MTQIPLKATLGSLEHMGLLRVQQESYRTWILPLTLSDVCWKNDRVRSVPGCDYARESESVHACFSGNWNAFEVEMNGSSETRDYNYVLITVGWQEYKR